MEGLLLAWLPSLAPADVPVCHNLPAHKLPQRAACGSAGTVYYNADCQTPRAAAPASAAPALSRASQTLRTAAAACQAPRHAAVQMARRGLVLDASRDQMLRPGELLLARTLTLLCTAIVV